LQVIFRQEPSYAGPNHWRARLVLDRAGALFVTAGRALRPRDEAQNPQNVMEIALARAPASAGEERCEADGGSVSLSF
jgi:glucose/arabinose dehydrogenase